MIGFIMIGNLTTHANDSGALNGTTATYWTNFMSYVWIAIGVLAFTPLIMVIVVFSGLFGIFGGGGRRGD